LRQAGHQIARKLTVLCWHLLTEDKDYLWARAALVANKTRAMELPAGKPQRATSRASLCLQRGDTARPGVTHRRACRAQLRPLRRAMKTRSPSDGVSERLNPAAVDGDTRVPHKASVMSSTRRTETPARYISITTAASTELSRCR
jgi:hypothetical protein